MFLSSSSKCIFRGVEKLEYIAPVFYFLFDIKWQKLKRTARMSPLYKFVFIFPCSFCLFVVVFFFHFLKFILANDRGWSKMANLWFTGTTGRWMNNSSDPICVEHAIYM